MAGIRRKPYYGMYLRHKKNVHQDLESSDRRTISFIGFGSFAAAAADTTTLDRRIIDDHWHCHAPRRQKAFQL